MGEMNYTLDDYQQDALRTWRTHLPRITAKEYYVLCQILAAAEVVGRYADMVKKAIFHGKGGIDAIAKQMTDDAVVVQTLMETDVNIPGGFADYNPELVNHMRAIIGVVGESAEVIDHIMTAETVGGNVHDEEMKLELGDILYYAAVGAANIGLPLSQVAAANKAKLIARYPEGFQPQLPLQETA